MHITLKLIVLSLVFSIVAFAEKKAKTIQFRSGPEFEFTHTRLIEEARRGNRRGDHMLSGEESAYALKFYEYVQNLCAQTKSCKTETVKGKWSEPDYKVTFENGFWFKISYDPATVEIQAKPLFLFEWVENRDLVQKFIFDTAKKLDLYVDGFNGAGHFNFDFQQAFGSESKRFLKFFVLLANNSELFSGVLGLDLLNAPPVSALSQKSRDALKQLVDEFKGEQGSKDRKFKTPRDLAMYIQRKIYTSHPYKNKGANEKREQAYNIMEPAKNSDQTKSVPSEVRGLNAQENPEQYEAIHDFFQDLVNYAESTKDDINYVDKDIGHYGSKELFNRFYALTRLIYPEEKTHAAKWVTLRTLLPGEMARLRPDALLSGTINWNFKSHIQLVETYFEDSVHNEFVRKMLIKALEEGVSIGNAEAIKLKRRFVFGQGIIMCKSLF